MVTRYEVTLNNVSMASVDSSILIHDVKYEKPEYSRNLFQLANRQGANIGKSYKRRSAVMITFEIRKYDVAERQEVAEKLIKWARNGGDLRINDRPGQKLICVCDELPAFESVRDWTSELSVTFAAYVVPYWQSTSIFTTSGQYRKTASTNKEATFQSFEVDVPGNAPCFTPKAVYVRNFSTSASNTQVYLEMRDQSRDDGTFRSNMIFLNAQSGISYEYTYDDNQILQYVCRYGGNTYNMLGRLSYTEIYDVLLTCGIVNDFKVSLTTRAYNSSDQVVYTPVNADVTIEWKGYWE